MNKRVFSILLALTASVVFSGCGKAESEYNSSVASQAETTTTAASEAPEVASETEESSASEETTAAAEPAPEITETVTDLFLSADRREVRIGEDDNELIFVARDIMIDTKVEMVDADTGEVVGVMLDDADFTHSGDDMKGDAWYSLRYKVDVDFPTDPDVSEDRDYHFYARYIEGTVEHRSEELEIFVYESFTEKELNDMETVDNSIMELMNNDGYDDLSIDKKREQMLELLTELENEGLIDKGSISSDGDNIHFTYCGGIGSGVMLKPFDQMKN